MTAEFRRAYQPTSAMPEPSAPEPPFECTECYRQEYRWASSGPASGQWERWAVVACGYRCGHDHHKADVAS